MKLNKTLKIIGTVLKIFVGIVIIGFVLTVLLQRFSNNEISFFNLRMFSVRTGSMEPKYKIGDVLLSKEVDPADIKVGDAISYLGDEGGYNGLIITHEVIKIENNPNGKLDFIAQGIANPTADPPVSEDQVYGIIVYKSVILSFIYKVISTPAGMYICVILPLIAMIGYEIVVRMLDKEQEKREKQKKRKRKQKDPELF